MGSKKVKLSSKAALPFTTANKIKRQDLFAKQKKARENLTRDERMRRKREENKDPRLREERRRKNIPLTLERKRTWDVIDPNNEDALGLSIDVEQLKRQKLSEEADALVEWEQLQEINEERANDDDEKYDSMIDSGSDTEDETSDSSKARKGQKKPTERARSPASSVASQNLALTPESLSTKFPSLFAADPQPEPKILITTSINSTLHQEAKTLTSFFPNSVYIRRSAHRYGRKFSVREVSSFAANRKYTIVIFLLENQKKPSGMDVVHLPNGPMFHYSTSVLTYAISQLTGSSVVSNWVESRHIPGHGRAQPEQNPEIILNGFVTPLGHLAARSLYKCFPQKPDFRARQVVTFHNQRDYIFVRRHRYMFRNAKSSEKTVVGRDGKELKGAEGIRAPIQELGPRMTLKLRRIDKGIQRDSGQEWEWKGNTEKTRTKFQL